MQKYTSVLTYSFIFKYLLLALFLVFNWKGYSQISNRFPEPKVYVSDFAGLLSKHEVDLLESRISEYDQISSVQISVVMVETLLGWDISDLAPGLAAEWGVGQKDSDNGILILIKPKYPDEKGQVFISVAYGLEYLLTDFQTKRIIERLLIPNFKKENYYEGINSAISRIEELIGDEFIATSAVKKRIEPYILVLIIFVISLLLLPVFYLIYLTKRKVGPEYDHFYIHGEYNMDNVLAQVAELEKVNKKDYSTFKKYVRKYDLSSRHKLIKYADKIDRTMFCYLLNGRSRLLLFRNTIDPFLLVKAAYVILVFSV